MSAKVTYVSQPVPALADPAPNTVVLALDPLVPRRVWGVYRVSEAVGGAPRPAARGLVVALVAGSDVEALLPFREAVFYEDDESVSGDLRTGWFVIDVGEDSAGCFVHAFVGLAGAASVVVP